MKTLAPAVILASLCWPLLSSSAQAENDPYYLVEVIVLTHADGRSDDRKVEQIADFQALLDPLRQSRIADWQERQAPDSADAPDTESPEQARLRETAELIDLFSAMDATEPAAALETEPMDPGPVYPDPFVNQPELSPGMQAAWDRLASSGEFRPRTWRAWYQPLSRSHLSPPLRVHDEFPVRLNSAELALAALPGSRQQWTVDELMPKADYRLDGSLRLRQRQFMHVELDLVWREPVETDVLPAGPWAQATVAPAWFRQHRLTQSRTVRPERLEYFDSSWLGVLVRIERWQSPEDDEPSRPSPD
jgi:hypothetical protein